MGRVSPNVAQPPEIPPIIHRPLPVAASLLPQRNRRNRRRIGAQDPGAKRDRPDLRQPPQPPPLLFGKPALGADHDGRRYPVPRGQGAGLPGQRLVGKDQPAPLGQRSRSPWKDCSSSTTAQRSPRTARPPPPRAPATGPAGCARHWSAASAPAISAKHPVPQPFQRYSPCAPSSAAQTPATSPAAGAAAPSAPPPPARPRAGLPSSPRRETPIHPVENMTESPTPNRITENR